MKIKLKANVVADGSYEVTKATDVTEVREVREVTGVAAARRYCRMFFLIPMFSYSIIFLFRCLLFWPDNRFTQIIGGGLISSPAYFPDLPVNHNFALSHLGHYR